MSSSGHLLGMAVFFPPTSPAWQVAKTDEAEIQLLAGYPESRGHGVGSSLINVCEQQAVSCGYFKMVLSTQPAMKAAHRLYEKQGYRRNPKRNWTRHEDKKFYVYEKVASNLIRS